MSREELEIILKREASVPKPQIEGVLDAMVAAYNRAIDDALNCHSQYGDGLWAVNVEELQKLKVG